MSELEGLVAIQRQRLNTGTVPIINAGRPGVGSGVGERSETDEGLANLRGCAGEGSDHGRRVEYPNSNGSSREMWRATVVCGTNLDGPGGRAISRRPAEGTGGRVDAR